MQKKKRGRLAACFLAFCMAFSMLLYVPEGAWKVSADSLQTYDGLMYRISNTTASVLGLEDTLKEVVIPAKVDGRSVISIENCAFDGETSIRKVVIPSSVVALGNHAFRNCTNLSEVEGGESLDNIGFDVMENTAWLKNRQDEVAVLGGKVAVAAPDTAQVTIPDGVTRLADGVFMERSSLESVALPESLERIGEKCFIKCENLESISLNENLMVIDSYAFYGCTKLKAIQFPASIWMIGFYAFQGCTALNVAQFGSDSHLQILLSGAFEDCTALRSITLPASLNQMYEGVFRNCTSLSMAAIQGSLTQIPGNSFSGCTMLEYVGISDSVTRIDSNAFSNCTSLRSLKMPSGLKTIGEYAFSMCTNLNSFELPETLERIGKDAFFHTGWMEAQTDDWKICDGVLLAYDGKETSIIIPGDIRLIASGFLSNYSKVKNVTLSYGLESVSPGAFAGCESPPHRGRGVPGLHHAENAPGHDKRGGDRRQCL